LSELKSRTIGLIGSHEVSSEMRLTNIAVFVIVPVAGTAVRLVCNNIKYTLLEGFPNNVSVLR